jgi:amino acid transporter
MEKKLKLMKFWLVGVFAILFAGLFGFFYTLSRSVGGAVMYAWPSWLITAVLCVGAYYFYKWFIGRKK